jgi:hypothetical protein
MVSWYNTEAEEAIRALAAPLRLINSDYQPTNMDAGQELAVSFGAVFMSDVGHFVMMEDPETFNRLLEEVVEEMSGDPHTGAGD